MFKGLNTFLSGFEKEGIGRIKQGEGLGCPAVAVKPRALRMASLAQNSTQSLRFS